MQPLFFCYLQKAILAIFILFISPFYIHANVTPVAPAPVPIALIWAIQENNLHKVAHLLTDKQNINNQDFLGYSPLHYAAKYGKAAIVERLLEAKPLLNQVSLRNGNTPLLLAIERGHKKILSLLLAAGADPNIPNHQGHHPLQLAIEQNKKDLAQLLLQAGATCSLSPSPLLLAIKARSLPIVQSLLAQKDIVETKDAKGYTELHWAAKENVASIFQALLQSGRFNINAQAANGATPLHLIVFNKKSKLLKTLSYAPLLAVNVQDLTGSTPLHYAVVANHLKAVKCLLHYDALDVNLPNHLGQTALHYAVEYGHTAIVKALLLPAGRGVWIKNNQGITPLELAMHQNNSKICKFMLVHLSLLAID